MQLLCNSYNEGEQPQVKKTHKHVYTAIKFVNLKNRSVLVVTVMALGALLDGSLI